MSKDDRKFFEGLFNTLRSDFSDMKSDFSILRSEFGGLRSEFGDLKVQVEKNTVEIHKNGIMLENLDSHLGSIAENNYMIGERVAKLELRSA
jgi:hypothetical protein